MRIITKEFKAYKYDELSEEAKKYVRQKNSDNNTEIETEFLEENFVYDISEKHPYFKKVKFAWSLGCCQGDGLSFSCDIDKSLFLETYFKDRKQNLKDIFFNYVYNFRSLGNKGRYCFCSENQIILEEETKGKHIRIDEFFNEVLEKAQEVYVEVCKEYEKQGYEAYASLSSDEYARENSEVNEYEYSETGRIL